MLLMDVEQRAACSHQAARTTWSSQPQDKQSQQQAERKHPGTYATAACRRQRQIDRFCTQAAHGQCSWSSYCLDTMPLTACYALCSTSLSARRIDCSCATEATKTLYGRPRYSNERKLSPSKALSFLQ